MAITDHTLVRGVDSSEWRAQAQAGAHEQLPAPRRTFNVCVADAICAAPLSSHLFMLTTENVQPRPDELRVVMSASAALVAAVHVCGVDSH